MHKLDKETDNEIEEIITLSNLRRQEAWYQLIESIALAILLGISGSKLAYLQIIPTLGAFLLLLDDLKSKSLIITIMITLCLAILKSAAFTVYFLYITFRLETSDNFEDYSISILGLSGKFVAWILLIMSLLEVAYIYYAAESLEQSRKLLRITEKPIKLTEREDEDFGFKTEQDLDN